MKYAGIIFWEKAQEVITDMQSFAGMKRR